MAKKKSKPDSGDSPKAKPEGKVRVQMLADMAGTGYLLGVGQEYDLPAEEAAAYVAAGFAVPVEG